MRINIPLEHTVQNRRH